jgi:folate-binding protein YgfZ
MTSSAYLPTSTHLFEMKGNDARDFLHRLTTTNIRDLDPGDFRPGFFLNPQGKIRASFRVACRAPDSFYLEVEGGAGDAWKASLLTVMDQFTFAEKYVLTEMKELSNAWIFGLLNATENRLEERTIDGETLILLHGSKRAFDTHWTSVWGPRTMVDRFVTAETTGRMEESEFDRTRIQTLFPRIDRELVLDSNPLEIGMREAVADNKGCYPGQEVIEKIVSLGSPAKRLALLSGSGPLPAHGAALRTADGIEVGSITSATREENEGFAALALLRKNVATEGKKLNLAGPHADSPLEVNVERVSDYE